MLASSSQKPRVVQAERFDLDVTQRMYFETTSTIPDTFRFGFMSTIADKDFPLDRPFRGVSLCGVLYACYKEMVSD